MAAFELNNQGSIPMARVPRSERTRNELKELFRAREAPIVVAWFGKRHA